MHGMSKVGSCKYWSEKNTNGMAESLEYKKCGEVSNGLVEEQEGMYMGEGGLLLLSWRYNQQWWWM